MVEDGRRVLSDVVLSQEDLHRRFGGVVPKPASREHVLGIMPAVSRALEEAGGGWDGVDAVAVSRGPGLAGSLLVGVNAAKGIAAPAAAPGGGQPPGRPCLRHLARRRGAAPLPLLCLVVSGGHTELVLMTAHGHFTPLGRTRDDAGEAFDKVARILGLGYPGGPAVEGAPAPSTRPACPAPCVSPAPGCEGATTSASAASRRPCCAWRRGTRTAPWAVRPDQSA